MRIVVQVRLALKGRMLAMTNGQFQDNFNAYGVHLYQLGTGTSSAPAPSTNLKAVAQYLFNK
jgi:hypothetical protein